jgi:hypothetical protein
MKKPNKPVVATADNCLSSLRFGRTIPAVPHFNVVRRAKQGASYQVKVLLFQNLASRNYRVLQLC